MLRPQMTMLLNIHGVEVWKRFSFTKRLVLQKFRFISVSEFTLKRFISSNSLPYSACYILPNCIDPEFNINTANISEADLRIRYALPANAKILLAITRLQASERKKNYIKVIELLPALIETHGSVFFILGGQYDQDEYLFINQAADACGVAAFIRLAGYIREEDMAAHYQLADIYVLPGEKDGFGITFIEAMASGLPVITGNADGGRETLFCRQAGNAVDAYDKPAMLSTINKMLMHPASPAEKKKLAFAARSHFSFNTYKERLQKIVDA